MRRTLALRLEKVWSTPTPVGFADHLSPDRRGRGSAGTSAWHPSSPPGRGRRAEKVRSTPTPVGFADHPSPDRRGRGSAGIAAWHPSSPPGRGRGGPQGRSGGDFGTASFLIKRGRASWLDDAVRVLRSTPTPIGFADHLSPARRGRGNRCRKAWLLSCPLCRWRGSTCKTWLLSSPPTGGRGGARSATEWKERRR